VGGKPRAFKHQLGADRVAQIAEALGAASPRFDRNRFEARVLAGLDELELKARVNHIIECLNLCLPQPFSESIAVILKAAGQDAGTERVLRGFAAWPLIDFVGAYGLDELDISLSALRVLTERFSAEFAIRPFLERFPDETLLALMRWTADPNEHVRRLVSEGTRPLLPWGIRLRQFQRDPRPVLSLLDALKSDSSEYVRRSVANNLNDISKDHPDVVIETTRRWSADDSPERRRLIARALRTLVKQGNQEALAILGFGGDDFEVTPLRLTPRAVREGDSVELALDVVSKSTAEQNLCIDYRVYYVKAGGKRSAKTFKLKTTRIAPGDRHTVRKRHSMKRVTTRRHYAGCHAIEVVINGRVVASADFDLESVAR